MRIVIGLKEIENNSADIFIDTMSKVQISFNKIVDKIVDSVDSIQDNMIKLSNERLDNSTHDKIAMLILKN